METVDHESRRRLNVTYEHLLWALIGTISLAMRLARLGDAPLAAGEAREAVLAWRAATGQSMPVADYNPVLLAANSLLFTLFGTSDALARVLPAVFGACLALSPVFFRRWLGRVGAMASAFYLAISPTALVASRQLDGTVIAGVGTMAFLGGTLQFLETDRRVWLTVAAVGLALGVTAGTTVYGLVLPLILACLIIFQLLPDGYPRVPAQAASRIGDHARHVLLTFLVAILLFGTGLGWNIPGLGQSAAHLADWLKRFGAASDRAASPLTLLTVYELGAVVLGVAGAIWVVERRRVASQLLVLWAGLTVLLLALMPGRAPTDVLWAVLPLAMLAGMAIEGLTLDHSSSDTGLRVVHLVIVLTLWSHAYLMLARYAAFGDRTDLALALVAVVIQTLVVVSFGMILGSRTAIRGAAGGSAVALLALTLAIGWGVAYRRPADPREILRSKPTAANVRDLVETLKSISWQETGVPWSLAFTYEAPEDAVLAWYLRDFQMARRSDELRDLAAVETGSLAVTLDGDEPVVVTGDREYAGQDFALRRQWRLGDLGCRFWEPGCDSAFDWFLFRDGVSLPAADQWATLWRVSDSSQ